MSTCASQIEIREMALGFKETNIVIARGLNMLKAGPDGYESSNEEYQRVPVSPPIQSQPAKKILTGVAVLARRNFLYVWRSI